MPRVRSPSGALMPRRDRAYGIWHQKRQRAGNRRRTPSREKARNKIYQEPEEARRKGK